MKQILFTLLALLSAVGIQAKTVESSTGTGQRDIVISGVPYPVTGTVTYALNNVLTGTASSVIDVGTNPGVALWISGTAQVKVYWSMFNTANLTTTAANYTLYPGQNVTLLKQGRYLYFYSNPINVAGQRVSVAYQLLGNEVISASGAFTCADCATADNQTSGAQKAQVVANDGSTPIYTTSTATVGGASSPVDATWERRAEGNLTSTLATSVTASALGSAVELNIDGLSYVSISSSNNWGTATGTFQVSYDSTGNNWINESALFQTGGYSASISAFPRFYGYKNHSAKRFRVYCSAFSSGTNTLYISGYKTAPGEVFPVVSTAGVAITAETLDGSTMGSTAAGFSGASAQYAWNGTANVPITARSTSTGVTTSATSTFHPFSSYMASFTAFTPAATPTDILTITGSASQTVMIKKIVVSGVATAAGSFRLALIRRSTADSGGTATTTTAVTMDTGDAANTATFNLYSANPTLGTIVGQPMMTWNQPLGVAATAASPVPTVVWEANSVNKGIVLRGTSQELAINGLGAALNAGIVLDVMIYFDVM